MTDDSEARYRRQAVIVLVCVVLAGLLLIAVAAFGGEPSTTPVRQPGPNDALWLMGGGIFGALARALWTRGQRNFGWETLQDCFLGAAVGLLWTVEIAPLSGVWPPFELSPTASPLQRAGLVSVFVSMTVELLKQMLLRWAPSYMARLAPPPPKP